MDLFHLIYSSYATNGNMSPSELHEILYSSRIKNKKVGITGILLYREGSLFQVLEGNLKDVEALYEKILLDKRHDRIRKIVLEPIAKRNFGDWSMGYPKMTMKEMKRIPGLNDFFAVEEDLVWMNFMIGSDS